LALNWTTEFPKICWPDFCLKSSCTVLKLIKV
jgi:hypothetical protein